MNDEKRQERKRGRPPQPGLERYNLMLDRELAEWGKSQPGGLSGLVRDLLRKARARSGKPAG